MTITSHDFSNDRQKFDDFVRIFLHGRLKVLSVSALSPPLGPGIDFNSVETTALAEFFHNTPSPLSVLLRQTGLKDYLLRPITEVEFTGDSYEPVFSKFEQRIYNLAAHNDTAATPYRYVNKPYHDVCGDIIQPEPGKENTGHYFATRRSNKFVADEMTERLEAEAGYQTDDLPVLITNRQGSTIKECLQAALELARKRDESPACYIMQSRHTANRHFGTVLMVIAGGENPDVRRTIFFDNHRDPQGESPFRQRFADAIDEAFCNAHTTPLSGSAEDGEIRIGRINEEQETRHKDYDCSFHTFVMAKAMAQIACADPDLLLNGSIEEIYNEMTARIPEYFSAPGIQKSRNELREASIVMRWNIGLSHLERAEAAAENILPFPNSLLPELQRSTAIDMTITLTA